MSRSRNPKGQGGRLREEILEAAVALVDETSDPVLTLRGVARRAGISAPSIYAHFDDLPALVDAVIARSFAELTGRLTVAAATSHGTEASSAHSASDHGAEAVRALVAAATAYVQFAWDHRARYRLMFAADGYALNAIEAFAVVQSLVTRCAAGGTSNSTDHRLDTWMLWAGLHGVATLEKPARAEHRRLGTLDRIAMLETMVHRLARITVDQARAGCDE